MPKKQSVTVERDAQNQTIAVVTTESEDGTSTTTQRRPVTIGTCHRTLTELHSKRDSYQAEIAALDEEIGIWEALIGQLKAGQP